ncbi:MAG: tannase/feruloyl esterase family alpha/beta hydrolase, partial [Acidobacteriota bacterium]
LLLAAAAARFPLAAAGSCEQLTSLAISGATITRAESVAPGAFVLPGGTGGQAAQNAVFATLPPFCRVAATLTPTRDSDIKIEIWLPAANWNGKFQAVGNGGWSGAIAYPAMAAALGHGYAASSTDTGHAGSTAEFALGHPEKLVDFASRSVHEMTVAAKQVVSAHYGKAPSFSYWRGCSAGGRQGLKEAQQFPADFDGIVAGAPASDWTGRAAQSMRVGQILHRDEASNISSDQYRLLHRAVLAACDARDGVTDGVLENPRACTFDPAVLQCSGAADSPCLTRQQVDAARRIYTGAKNPQSGRLITGLEPGSELGWATWGGPQPFAIGRDHFRYVVFKNPQWDPRQFDFDVDVVRAEEGEGSAINALDPDLRPFFGRGGKLLQYHGWNDPQISPGSSVQYYDRVVDRVGGAATDNSYRLFMVPGMAHCSGGEGPNTFDPMTALEAWVERGRPPAALEASMVRDGKVARTRPLCPYPQTAAYQGAGSTDDAANFTCRTR